MVGLTPRELFLLGDGMVSECSLKCQPFSRVAVLNLVLLTSSQPDIAYVFSRTGISWWSQKQFSPIFLESPCGEE
jgi:hypothetical protein